MNPQPVAITLDGQTAYVIENDGPTIRIINLTTNASTGTIASDTNATAIAISPDGHTAYVSISAVVVNQIDVVNLTTNTVTSRISLGTAGPRDVAVAPDGQHVYLPWQALDASPSSTSRRAPSRSSQSAAHQLH